MGANSRNKGSAFERTIAAKLFELTGVSFKRNLEQYRSNDHSDLTPDNKNWPFAIEAKRYAAGTGCKPEWQEQVIKAASKINKIPVVIYKYDRRPIRCAMPMSALCNAHPSDVWVETTIEGLAYLASEKMAVAQ